MVHGPQHTERTDFRESNANLFDLTKEETLQREGRIAALKAKRLLAWILFPHRWPRPKRVCPNSAYQEIFHRKIQIARSDPYADQTMEAGKVTNLKIAAAAFHNLSVSPHRPLSFWRTLGQITRDRGYKMGMELKGGCIIPSLGGGVCLISNVLFQMAAELGWNILERHGHTMEAIPTGDDDIWGLDATVFYPYVDLRVAPSDEPAVLQMTVEGQFLHVTVLSEHLPQDRVIISSVEEQEHVTGVRVRTNAIQRLFVDGRTGQTRH